MPETADHSSAAGDLTAFGPARSTIAGAPLSAEELRQTDAFWRACNYLAVGMIYLLSLIHI